MADFNKSRNSFFGTFILNDGSVCTINCTSIIVRTTAVFSTIKVAGQAPDVRSRYLQDKGGSIPAGTELVCKDGYFSEITLEEGVVELVLMQRDPKPIPVPELPSDTKFRITACPGVSPGEDFSIYTDGFGDDEGFELAGGMFINITGVEPFPNGCYYVTEVGIGGPKIESGAGEITIAEEPPCVDCLENANAFVLFPCEGEEGEIFYADSAVGVDLNTYVGGSLLIGEQCYRVERSIIGGPALEAPFGDPCECGEEPPEPECPGGEIDECGNCTSDEGYLPPDECGNCPGDDGYPCEEPGEEFVLLIEGVEGSQVGNPDYEGAGAELPPPFGPGPEGARWVTVMIGEEIPEGITWPSLALNAEFGLPLVEAPGTTPWSVINQAGSAYLPSVGFDSIGDLQPGEVYQINITQSRTLNPGAVEGLEGQMTFYTGEAGVVITPEMFEAPDETGSNMTVGVNAGEALNTPYEGGQLGAFFDLNGDGNLQCVGLSTILSEFFAVAAWGNNPDTPEKDGLDNGNVPIFAILHEEQVYLFEPSPAFSGYVTDGIVIIADGTATPLEG